MGFIIIILGSFSGVVLIIIIIYNSNRYYYYFGEYDGFSVFVRFGVTVRCACFGLIFTKIFIVFLFVRGV